MSVVYALEEPPETFTKSLFAAGPTPRAATGATSWRPQMLAELEAAGYDGVVFVPEARDGAFHGDYLAQVDWETRHLEMADVIMFWVPREMGTMPALTTNVEWGMWARSGKVGLGCPPEGQRNRYLQYQAGELGVPMADTLTGTVAAALEALGGGAERTAGERRVPLHVWRTREFQDWYAQLRAAGNTLLDANVLWTYPGRGDGRAFCWALHVDVWVAAEGRRKNNEFVLSRPHVTSVLLYRPAATLADTEVVLVREFRSAVANDAGYVLELPGGSSSTPGEALDLVAAAEVAQETGLHLPASRLMPGRSRQVAPTLSAHRAHLFTCELTAHEIADLKAAAGVPFGVGADSECTYVEVLTVADLRRDDRADWTTLAHVLDHLA